MAGYQRTMGYDALGRPNQTVTTIDAVAYTMAAAYDGNGRLSQVTYPSGFAASKNAGSGPLQAVENFRASFGLTGLVAAGLSPTQQFAGSFRVDISPVVSEDATYLMFTVTNTSSMRSFLYGIGPVLAPIHDTISGRDMIGSAAACP